MSAGYQMNVKIVTFTMHDGNSLVKINPQRVNYLMSVDAQFTKIHFGPDQIVDVIGDLKTVETSLTNT